MFDRVKEFMNKKDTLGTIKLCRDKGLPNSTLGEVTLLKDFTDPNSPYPRAFPNNYSIIEYKLPGKKGHKIYIKDYLSEDHYITYKDITKVIDKVAPRIGEKIRLIENIKINDSAFHYKFVNLIEAPITFYEGSMFFGRYVRGKVPVSKEKYLQAAEDAFYMYITKEMCKLSYNNNGEFSSLDSPNPKLGGAKITNKKFESMINTIYDKLSSMPKEDIINQLNIVHDLKNDYLNNYQYYMYDSIGMKKVLLSLLPNNLSSNEQFDFLFKNFDAVIKSASKEKLIGIAILKLLNEISVYDRASSGDENKTIEKYGIKYYKDRNNLNPIYTIVFDTINKEVIPKKIMSQPILIASTDRLPNYREFSLNEKTSAQLYDENIEKAKTQNSKLSHSNSANYTIDIFSFDPKNLSAYEKELIVNEYCNSDRERRYDIIKNIVRKADPIGAFKITPPVVLNNYFVATGYLPLDKPAFTRFANWLNNDGLGYDGNPLEPEEKQ